MRRIARPMTLVALLAGTAAGPAAAQSAKDILHRVVAAYDRRMADVDNYTVVQEAMGMPTTMYFEKKMVEGHPVFRLRQSSVNGIAPTTSDDGDFDMFSELPTMAERAVYKGRETVDGHAVHVIVVNDLHDIRFARDVMPKNSDFQPKSATFYVDTERLVPLRLVIEGRMNVNGKMTDVTNTMSLSDYREVSGVLHPFHSAIRIDGLGQAVDPSTRRQYEEMKQRLAEMPESQRQAVEKMMKGQMEQMEKMMAGGSMNIEVVVKDLRVNAGPPKQ